MTEHEWAQRLKMLAARAGLRVSARTVASVGLILAVCVGVVIFRGCSSGGVEVYSSGDVAVTDAPSEAAGDPSADSEVATTSAEETVAIWVHVVGAVRHPGVFELLASARVSDVVEAAGGFAGNAAQESVNLARSVQDGEQVVVCDQDEWAAGGGAGGAGVSQGSSAEGQNDQGSSLTLVNINTADQTTLETLSGVGPSTAAKIIADRESNGAFAKPEDLMRVSGIGEKTFESLRDLITVQ